MPDLVKKFHRAARMRLDAAQLLRSFPNERHVVDALYLGGYSIECSMKSMILSGVSPTDRDLFAEEHFRGQIAHDFESLYHLWSDNGCERLPKVLLVRLRRAKLNWSTDLRYESGLGARRTFDVAALLLFAEDLWAWVEGRVT